MTDTPASNLTPEQQRTRLRRFLDDLGRLSAQHGVWLEDGPAGPILHFREDAAAGYIAWPAKDMDGAWQVDSYVNGAELDPEGIIVGDDHSPQGKEKRARIWREENAEALKQQASWTEGSPLPRITPVPPQSEDDTD